MDPQTEIHKAIDHLMDWADTDAWREWREEVFEDHFFEIAERLDYSYEEFMDALIENELAGPVFTFCFEDFATLRFEPDDTNVIEDFLKRRGWREGVRGQRYLRQLLDSNLSLYEVTEVVPGEYCVLADLIYERDPQRVYEHSGTQMMAKWDRIGARILPGDGKSMFSGAVLPFSHEASERVLRSEKALDMLSTLLGDLVTASLTELQSPQQIMRGDRHDEDVSYEADFDEPEIDPQELAATMKRQLDQHYRNTLDEPVPMLGNNSPRECVKTRAGKQKVIAWLKYLENQEDRMARNKSSTPYDFGWMWEELGLD